VTGPAPLLLGVDGGNTKSIALVARADGSIVGSGRSEGTADIHAVAIDEAMPRLDAAANAALAMAGSAVAPGSAGANIVAGFSLAGADWPEDFDELDERLADRWPRRVLVNDAIGALRAAIPGGPGVVVVCGTGATTGARGADGRTWHSSFWQETQGAHELGVEAVRAAIRAELGIIPPTAMTAGLLAALGEVSVEGALHRLTGRGRKQRGDWASLARVVLDAAEAGDAAATEIVERQGAALGRLAIGAARRVGILGLPFQLALTGGVVRHDGQRLRDAIVRAVREDAPEAIVVRPTLEPAVGALLLAFDLAGIAVTRGIDARLRATLPPTDLWDTQPRAAASAGS
jgi:N-acetylglucosamine kinase-like BadF-type ATPase